MLLYLIGYSYSGKTTVGRQLAKRLGYQFFDTDKAIELKYHTSIPAFFSHYGESAFRIIERQILQSTAELDNAVISTGGGMPCNDANISFILEHGIAFYFQMGVDDILQRISRAHRQRPSLAGKDSDEICSFVTAQLQQRLPYYTQAHHTIPVANRDIDDIITQIVREI